VTFRGFPDDLVDGSIALSSGELPAAVMRQFLKAVEDEERRFGRRIENTIEPADPREPTDTSRPACSR
jgi:hypothetical protein